MRELLNDIFTGLQIPADISAFEKYCDMLLQVNQVMNLTAITEKSEVAVRHFADRPVSTILTFEARKGDAA